MDIMELLLSMDIFATLVLFGSLLVVRAVAGRAVQAGTAPSHAKRRYAANIRTALFFVGLLGLVMIWAPQLRTFALSLTAVAAAIVIATKELILCLSGSFLRASSGAFSVGDWIEVGGVRGEVVDHNLLATKLQEFAEPPNGLTPTGRTVVLPNSLLLNTPVRNFSAMRGYAFHRFSLTFETGSGVFGKRPEILSILERHYAPYREGAVEMAKSVERRTGADIPDPEPSVRFTTTDLGKHRIEISAFCPIAQASRLEGAVTEDIMRLPGLDGIPAPASSQPAEDAAR